MQLPQLSLPFTARKSAVMSEGAVADMPKSLGPEILFSNPNYSMADQQELSQLDREFDIEGWKTADCMPGDAADLDKLWLDDEDSWLTTSPQENEDEHDMLCSDEEPSNTTVSTEVQARGYLNWSDPSTPIGLTEEYTGPMSKANAFLAGPPVLPFEALPRAIGIAVSAYRTISLSVQTWNIRWLYHAITLWANHVWKDGYYHVRQGRGHGVQYAGLMCLKTTSPPKKMIWTRTNL